MSDSEINFLLKNQSSSHQDKSTQPIALVDLDGTLCDYTDTMLKHLLELRGPSDDPEDELLDEPPPHILARRQMIVSTPGFWRNLKPISTGIQLANLLLELDFDTYVLTKGVKHSSTAWAEKFDWCRIHVPNLKVIVSENKSLVYGDVLVDDWPPYIVQWRKRFQNGLLIIPNQPWNVNIKAEALRNSIRYDGNNLEEVKAQLQSQKNLRSDKLL